MYGKVERIRITVFGSTTLLTHFFVLPYISQIRIILKFTIEKNQILNIL